MLTHVASSTSVSSSSTSSSCFLFKHGINGRQHQHHFHHSHHHSEEQQQRGLTSPTNTTVFNRKLPNITFISTHAPPPSPGPHRHHPRSSAGSSPSASSLLVQLTPFFISSIPPLPTPHHPPTSNTTIHRANLSPTAFVSFTAARVTTPSPRPSSSPSTTTSTAISSSPPSFSLTLRTKKNIMLLTLIIHAQHQQCSTHSVTPHSNIEPPPFSTSNNINNIILTSNSSQDARPQPRTRRGEGG